MSFSTPNLGHPEVVVLWTGRATLPLVTASLILGQFAKLATTWMECEYFDPSG
jgi:hypothetical protein